MRRRRADFLEKAIANELRAILFRPDVVEKLVEAVYECQMQSRGIRLESLDSELKELEKKISNISRNVERVANVPVTLLERLAELEKERDVLLVERDAEQLRIQLPKDEIRNFILNFNTEYDDNLLRTFVTRVVLYDDHAVVEYDAIDKAVDVPLDECSTTLGHSSTNPDNTRTFYYIENATLYIIIKL